jgi:CHC2-type zinc finger protein
MITASELAGFIAAHAIWCVSEADGLILMVAFTTEDRGLPGFLWVRPNALGTLQSIYGFLFSIRGTPDECECGCDNVGVALMPAVDFQAVRASVSLAQVLELIGFEPTERRGNQWRGPCPIHGSTSRKSRSFSAHLGKNAFRCFRCGAEGNQLDLWTTVSGTDLHAATLTLCRRLGLEVPCLPSRPRPQASTNPKQRRGTRSP